MPRLYDAAGHPRHPAIAALKTVMNYDDFFKDEQIVRRAVASYYALVSFLDHNIGQVIGGDREGRADGLDARDLHLRSRRQSRLPRPLGQVGDVRGVGRDSDDRRRGRRRRRARVVDTPVSLIDCYRTVLEAVGCPLSPDDLARPSHSLWEHRRGRATRPHRPVRISRRCVGDRDIHDPPRPLEIHPSCRIPAGAVRSRERSGRNNRSRRAARHGAGARGVRRRAAAHLRSRGGERRGLRGSAPPHRRRMAGARRSWRAETMVTRRRPERSLLLR